jgi:cytochrome c553
MKTGKLIAIIITGILMVIMGYMLIQDVTSSSSKEEPKFAPKTEQTKEDLSQRFQEPEDEEDKKLKELKKLAGSLSTETASKTYLVKCSSCHGKNGEGTQVAPSLQGKSVEYMLAKLDDYRHDRVKNSLMRGLLDNTSDEELASLAVEISKF